MQKQIAPDFPRSFWEQRFPGQGPAELALPEIGEARRYIQNVNMAAAKTSTALGFYEMRGDKLIFLPTSPPIQQ